MPWFNNVDTITSELKRFRRRLIRNDLQTVKWLLIPLAMMGIPILLALEAIFWFPSSVRYGAWITGAIAFLFFIAAGGVTAILIALDKIPRYALETCAWKVGAAGFEKKDGVLNALQLEASSPTRERFSRELAGQFIQTVLERLRSLNPSEILQNPHLAKLRRIAGGVALLSIIPSLVFLPPLRDASARWMHPQTDFPIPLPLEIVSPSGNLSLMGGDDATITFLTEGGIPDHVMLEVSSSQGSTVTKLLPSDENRFIHKLGNILQNLSYRAFVKSSHFWEPWDEISSPVYTIDVIDRPTIEKFTVTVIPPNYTGLDAMSQEENIAEIRGLKGSVVKIQLKADKPLSRAYLKFAPAGKDDEPEPSNLEMKTERNRAWSKFQLMENGSFSTFILDERNVANLDPIQYRLLAMEDTPPELEVIQPESHTELGGDFVVPIQLHIEDDFGFSRLQIVYETAHPDYISAGMKEGASELVSIHGIEAFPKEQTSQDVYHLWDVGDLNLVPEDELRFHFELYDNDEISGPKKAISPTLVARFPSLSDLLVRTVEKEQAVEENAQTIMEDFQEVNESLESIELEVLKSQKLNWEQQETLKKTIKEVEKNLEEIESLKEELEEIASQSEKHTLFSDELIEKFRNLNELLQEIMTPELLDSMDKFRDAMENLSPEEVLNALKDFRLNTSAIERQLDRFIDIFRRIQAEQKIDELVTRMEDLTKRQEALASKITQDQEPEDILRLSEEQKRNAREFENIKALMNEASKSMEPFAKMPSRDLKRLAQSEVADRASKKMEATSLQLGRQNVPEGAQAAQEAGRDLGLISAQLQEIRQSFRQETLEKMIARFETALRNTLFISKEQERLQSNTENLPRNSPRLGEMATRQQLLRDQLAQLIQGLMELSRETFAVSPEMGKAIGRATVGMNESLKKLEERNGRASVERQGETVTALNEAALATLAAIHEMEASGSSSGLEQFMERMRQMAAQQRGINEQSLQLALGQMAVLAREGLIQRLKSQQEQLKKSLEQLIREMRGSGEGGQTLGGIAEDMQEVIRDFERRRVNRRTVKRQERILSRMLDYQRSMRQRDFSEKRKGTTAKDIYRQGPSGLPADLGQRRNFAMEALKLALKGGYPRDYQEMIRAYFNSLIELPEMADEQDDVEQ